MPKAKEAVTPTRLIFVGGGFYVDVPARDLTAEEVEQYGGVEQLTKDGYYRLPDNEVSDGN